MTQATPDDVRFWLAYSTLSVLFLMYFIGGILLPNYLTKHEMTREHYPAPKSEADPLEYEFHPVE